jgi:hypothetical protein
VPADAHDLVKVVVGDVNVVAPETLSDVQVPRVCRSQFRFCVFGPKKVWAVDVAVLLQKVREVLFECRLRCLRPSNLDTLAKCPQPLLLPND